MLYHPRGRLGSVFFPRKFTVKIIGFRPNYLRPQAMSWYIHRIRPSGAVSTDARYQRSLESDLGKRKPSGLPFFALIVALGWIPASPSRIVGWPCVGWSLFAPTRRTRHAYSWRAVLTGRDLWRWFWTLARNGLLDEWIHSLDITSNHLATYSARFISSL